MKIVITLQLRVLKHYKLQSLLVNRGPHIASFVTGNKNEYRHSAYREVYGKNKGVRAWKNEEKHSE